MFAAGKASDTFSYRKNQIQMIAKLKELRKNEDGFTLIELMVVVLIIGILAAIAIPVFLNLQKEGIKASIKSDVKNTVTNIATALASEGASGTVAAADAAATTVAVGASTADLVESDGNVITVTAGNIGTYQVAGSNPGVTGFTYTFTANNGEYN